MQFSDVISYITPPPLKHKHTNTHKPHGASPKLLIATRGNICIQIHNSIKNKMRVKGPSRTFVYYISIPGKIFRPLSPSCNLEVMFISLCEESGRGTLYVLPRGRNPIADALDYRQQSYFATPALMVFSR